MKVAAIFINYRTARLTFEAVVSLHERLGAVGPFGIWVIDNDSQDGSFALLSELVSAAECAPEVHVSAAPKNGGYGYGINFGVQAVFDAGHRPDYIYVLNTDAFAEPGALEELVSFMDQHPRVGLAGHRVQDFEGHTQGCGFRFPTAFSAVQVFWASAAHR
jgi:GT2 family glycosyltransferase